MMVGRSAKSIALRSGLVILASLFATALEASDKDTAAWPQWRGPNRDGISHETGLLTQWPENGPELLWKSGGAGEGYSSLSIAQDRIITMGNRDGQELVVALSTEGGRELWATSLGAVRANGGGYPGPRCTPTIDGNLVFALGINGDLVCLKADDGKVIWKQDLAKDYGGEMMSGWGYSESPLVDGDRLLCTPGGNTATIVALRKQTGKLIWKARIPSRGDGPFGANPDQGDRAAYSSIVRGSIRGVEQYVQFLGTGVAGIAVSDGSFLWRYNSPANGTANISTPVIVGNSVFAASEYGTGGGLVDFEKSGRAIRPREVYFTKNMQNKHGGMVVIDDHIYGFDGGVLRCLDLRTGKSKWENRSVGMGSVVYAAGHLICRGEQGPIALVEATPSGHVEKGRFSHPDASGRETWAYPSIAGGRLYLRDQDMVYCYDIRQ